LYIEPLLLASDGNIVIAILMMFWFVFEAGCWYTTSISYQFAPKNYIVISVLK